MTDVGSVEAHDLGDHEAEGVVADPTRQRLVDAAAVVFAERGYDRAGVQEIARRAGLTTGAIYGRFAGKAELLQAVIEERSDTELDQLFAADVAAERATDPLRLAGAHLVDPAPDPDDPGGDVEGALLLEAFVAARRDGAVRATLRQMLCDRAAQMAEVVEAGKADGTVHPDLDTEAVVAFAHAVGLGFVLYGAADVPLPNPTGWRTVIDHLVDSLAVAPQAEGGRSTDRFAADPRSDGGTT